AEAWTRMQKLTADTFVHADATRDIMYIAAYLVAQVRDFVDEGNLGCKESVRGILGQFGCFQRGDDERRFDQIERAVEIFHDRNCFFITTADHNSIWSHEIVYCGAFSEKLRIRNNSKIGARLLALIDQ